MGTGTKSGSSSVAGAKKRLWLKAWVPHRLEMLISPAWTHAPQPLRRILERLEVEHLRHGGQHNGYLHVAFSQFVLAGVSKRTIRPSIDLGQALGLLECVPDDEPAGDIRGPNRYRLTYVPAKGQPFPTDEWKRVTQERAEKILKQFRASSDGQKSQQKANEKAA
ncbi:hypothetical protein NKK52_07125 [Mesorhizobium sp. C277A]|uniref:hypothetical protein n=1 Tax=unclassified Mesorhizobium TaxID=325217 RepID=UPI000A020E26|nr:hypothetical protein [Mesorhizobium sp. LSJC277A00]